MVTNVTSLTGNGLKDWLIQRFTAIILGIYLVILSSFFATHAQVTYLQWQAFMHCKIFMVVNVLMIISLVLHAWIGLWTVTTDYIKATCIRLPLQLLIFIGLFSLLIWFFMILWG